MRRGAEPQTPASIGQWEQRVGLSHDEEAPPSSPRIAARVVRSVPPCPPHPSPLVHLARPLKSVEPGAAQRGRPDATMAAPREGGEHPDGPVVLGWVVSPGRPLTRSSRLGICTDDPDRGKWRAQGDHRELEHLLGLDQLER